MKISCKFRRLSCRQRAKYWHNLLVEFSIAFGDHVVPVFSDILFIMCRAAKRRSFAFQIMPLHTHTTFACRPMMDRRSHPRKHFPSRSCRRPERRDVHVCSKRERVITPVRSVNHRPRVNPIVGTISRITTNTIYLRTARAVHALDCLNCGFVENVMSKNPNLL